MTMIVCSREDKECIIESIAKEGLSKGLHVFFLLYYIIL